MRQTSNKKTRYLLSWLTVFVGLWVLAASGGAADKPPHGAVASAHPLATEAGLQILARGGNAFDAAVAVSAALAVVEPYSSGLGGGGLWLLHRAADDSDVMVDGRETAPAAATRTMYLDAKGQPVAGLSREGPLSAGIPGQPAGLVHIAQEYGTLPLPVLFEPAIRYAKEGHTVDTRLHSGIQRKRDLLNRWPAGRAIFLRDGEVPPVGSILRQPDLARVLEQIAAKGKAGFYTGDIAAKLVAGVQTAGGIWTAQDLADYEVVEREPLYGCYGGMRIITAPPPSAGGVALINVLNILAGYDLASASSIQRTHLLIEAMRRAYRDRAEFLGDPDFIDIPVDRLVHPFYAAGQRASIRNDIATPSQTLPGISTETGEGMDTTHFSILDRQGNRVAGTMSINFWFGSGFVAPETGVLLNNEMDDFSVKPGVPDGYELVGGEANSIAPGKRMVSSMTPTFLESERGIAILGTPGGSRIISMVLLAALAWEQGASAAQMVDLTRFHHQYLPDRVVSEPGTFSESAVTALEELGHQIREIRRYGNMQIVTWDYDSGEVAAVSDPRGVGEGLVY